MTIRKQFPPRDYETFPSSNSSEAGQGSNQTPSTTDSDKTRLSAAQEAQRLASQGSWADNYVFRTPGTTMTPTASTVDEEDRREAQHEQNAYPSDPPPQYTPTDTTGPSVPNSPVTARAEPVGGPQPPRRPSTPPLVTSEDVDEDQPMPGAYTPSSSLLERGEQGEPNFFKPGSPRWRGDCKNSHARRCKKAAWFTFALVACLWLMVPSLFYDKPGTKSPPHHPHDDLGDSPIPTWPVPKREYRQHETSNSIHGTFELYDLLDLETTSGSISITVETKSGDKPAVMRLASSSGSINVRMAGSSWLPWKPALSGHTNRTLDIRVSTTSGSVSGSFLAGHGGSTEISTRSGSQSITIYTSGVTEDAKSTRLLTSSNSGSQHVKVESSSIDKVKAIEGRHLSHGSGSLGIEYPRQWQGKVHAHIGGSGSVSVSGHGLQKQGGGRNVYAWRGEGDLKEVEVYGKGSGSIRFSC